MKNSIDAQFGQAIKRLRTERGVSQESLASRSSLHRTYISDVERGERNLSLKSIKSLADGLGVSLCRLFAEVEHKATGVSHQEFEGLRLGGNQLTPAARKKSDD